MRLNRIVVVVALIVGLGGSWLTARAFQQYLDATEAFSLVDLRQEPDTFRWLDPDYGEAEAVFEFVNRSERDITVESLSLSLRFDQQFAGADYAPWEPMEIPAGERRTFPATFTITANSIQHRGGDANLSFRGQMKLSFANIEEPLVVRFRGQIGQVPYHES